jgi:hypothetical protein
MSEADKAPDVLRPLQPAMAFSGKLVRIAQASERGSVNYRALHAWPREAKASPVRPPRAPPRRASPPLYWIPTDAVATKGGNAACHLTN